MIGEGNQVVDSQDPVGVLRQKLEEATRIKIGPVLENVGNMTLRPFPRQWQDEIASLPCNGMLRSTKEHLSVRTTWCVIDQND